jgi:PleD family two-component response regulator
VPGPEGTFLSATVSAGCSGIGQDNDRIVDAIARADVGLVTAKRAGRNRVVVA